MFSVHPRRPQRLRQESPGPLPERGVQHRRLELRGDVPAGQVDDDDGVSRSLLSERGDEEQDHQQVPQHREEQPRHRGQTRLPRLCR